jgi:hypothetical protein
MFRQFGAIGFMVTGRQRFVSMLLLLVLLPVVAVLDSNAASAVQRSFFTTAMMPTHDDSATTSGLELGLEFQSSASAYAMGVRFHKAPANTGTHTGYIKNASQTVLATVTFTDESASGWQTAYFSSPVLLSANTTYFVSYIAPNGDYSYTSPYFNTYVNPPGLTAVRSVFDGDTDPNDAAMNNFSSANYWVDVLIESDPTIPPTLDQTSYRWQNDDGANLAGNTNQAAANTAITGVNRSERLDLRVQLQNSGAQVSEDNRYALFYDRSDGYWTKVGQDDIPKTAAGNCDNTTWSCATVDSAMAVTGTTSTAISADGTSWTAYVDSTSGQLRLARYVGVGGTGCSSAAWTCMVVDGGGPGVVIEPGVSLTFSSTGTAWISYQRNNTLAVARYVGTGGTGCTQADESTTETRWTCTTVDSSANAGDTSAIGADFSGKPWIAYDNASGGLTVARYVGTGGTCTSTAWTCTTVHTIGGGGVAGDVSIGFATGDKAWVSYQDQTGADLWVASYVGTGGTCTSSAWSCTAVDSTGTVGAGTSLGFAANGMAAVSYLDNTSGTVKFAQYDGDGVASGCAVAAWTCTTVVSIAGTTAFTTGLAFGPDGRAWIAYSDATAGPTANDLKIARYDADAVASGCTSVAWSCSTVQSTGTVGANVSLAFDAKGHPWVSHNGGGALAIATVDRAGEVNASAATAATHDTVITAPAAGACSTWRDGRKSSSGEVSKVYLAAGECTELGFSLQTTSSLASTTYRFMVAVDTGATAKNLWRGVGSVSNMPTLTTSSTATMRASKDVAPQWTACPALSAWSCTEVETAGHVGRHAAGAIDPNGNPWIAYFNEDNQELRVAQYVGSGGTGCTTGTTNWKCSSVDGDGAGDSTTSIAFDNAGNPWITYHRYTDDQVRVARYVGTNGSGCATTTTRLPEWTCLPVAHGTESSLAFDKAGQPWLSWYDTAGTQDLRIARYVGAGGTGCLTVAWNCEIIDNSLVLSTSMAIDSKGAPWLSYVVTGATTKVAHYVGMNGNCTNAAWDCTVVETTGSNLIHTAIAIDGQDRPWVSSLRNANQPVRYAMYDGDGVASGCVSGPASWTCGEIGSDSNMIDTTAIAIGPDGNPWVVYIDGSGGSDLYVAQYTGVSNSSCNLTSLWQCYQPYAVDSGFGAFPIVMFDRSGTPWVVHGEQGGSGRDQTIAKLALPGGPPSLRNANVADGRNATGGDGRHRLTWGDTARPMSGSCDGVSDKQGYCGIAADDSSYEAVSAQQNEAPLFNFAVPVTDVASLPSARWKGQSSIAASAKTLTLEAYRFGSTNAWVSVDTDTVCAANTDCILTGSATGVAADYYQAVGGDQYVYWRIRQDASSASTTSLKTNHMQAPLNTAPNAPTSLTQRRSDNVTAVATGGWTGENQVRLGGAVSDPDSADSLQLCIERKPTATAFDGTGEVCASLGAYSGTPLTQSISETGITENTYHWRARAKDAAGATSAWVFYNGADATHFGVDLTAPTAVTVFDGASEDVDATFNDGSLSQLSANWDAFTDASSGIAGYEYSIGTAPGGTTIRGWTSLGSAMEILPASGLTLRTSQIYYVNVRGTDVAGNATIASSDGQTVAPTLTFSVLDPTIDLGLLSLDDVTTDTLTMTTSTNAYGGYQVRARLSHLMAGPNGATIPAFSGGSYATPGAWGGSDYGLGYTSSDVSIQGLGNHFATGTLYAPFSTSAPGDVVADHASGVSGLPVTNESFDLSIRLHVPLTAAAGWYETTLILSATATY